MIVVLFHWMLAGLMSVTHPYYISVTEIEYDQRTREMGISCKFFPDDLESALKTYTGGKVDILKGDKAPLGKQLNDYILHHLTVNVNGKAVAPVFLGFENDREATWCYFSVKDVPAPKTIQVFNNLLYEYRKEEINMVHVIVDGNRKSTKLSQPDVSFTFSFP
jgi:hypothetical protein